MHLHRDNSAALDSLVSDLLKEERQGTAVEAFSLWHERARHGSASARDRYRELLPLSKPGDGEQYGFEVDLDACSGCKACVTACHSLNGLEDGESWRSVGLLVGRSKTHEPARLQHVTTACHHCVEPACQHGCPVLAYEKDPLTGIVRHLDDQCIGCTYCVMTCPYEVPRFSKRLGIVRKCDLCHGRLSEGEAPACAQACPNQAIRVTVVDQRQLRQKYQSPDQPSHDASFLPSSPPPHLSLPTTQFRSSPKKRVTLSAADEKQVSPAPQHLPLVVMLVLTQAAAGLALALPVLHPTARGLGLATIAALSLMGIAASLAHLGQPLRAWRVFLGWRRSWLSREALLLGAFSGTALSATGSHFLLAETNPMPRDLFSWMTTALALPAVLSSVMVYAVTGRDEWSFTKTTCRFLGTTLLLGPTILLALPFHPIPAPAFLLAALTTAGALLVTVGESIEIASWYGPDSRHPTTQRRARLAMTFLRKLWKVRILAAGTGVACLWLSSLFTTPFSSFVLPSVALILLLLGALSERTLFFTGSAPHRMPGGITA